MKNIFFFIFSATYLFAGKLTDSSGDLVYSFIVENGAMVDSYFNIFNAIAMIFQSNDYLELLKIVFLIGGFLVFVISIIDFNRGIGLNSLKKFLQYLLIGTALLTIMFSNKSSILIKTNNLTTFCPTGITNKESIVSSFPATTGVVVGNIPEVLAWTFSLINEVGLETTKLATKAFTATNSDFTKSYSSKSDYANYLDGINTVLNSKLTDFVSDFNSEQNSTLIEGLNALYRDCIAAPASNAGDIGLKVMSSMDNTGDIIRTLKDYFNTSGSAVNIYLNPSSPDKTTVISNFTVNGLSPNNSLANLNGNIYSCEQLWLKLSDILDSTANTTTRETRIQELKDLKDLNGSLTPSESEEFNRLNNVQNFSNNLLCAGNLKDHWNSQSLTVLSGDSGLTGSVAGKNIVLNAALANHFYDMKNNISQGDISYASAKTIAGLVTDNVGQGFYLAQMLPYLQMGMRAVMYAFFPLVFIVILLPGGISVLKNYLQTLIWIELWTPIAAVLNMFLSIMSTDKFAEMYKTKGFNVTQGLQTLSDSAMLAGLAGYLYAMIPALTWLLLKNSGSLLSGLGEGLAAKFNANLDSDNINKDLHGDSLEKLKKVNEARISKGEKMISLAELDKANSQIKSFEEAGSFNQKSENKDKIFDNESVKTKIDIVSNNTIGERILNNFNAVENISGLIADTKGNIEKKTANKDQIDQKFGSFDFDLLNTKEIEKTDSKTQKEVNNLKNIHYSTKDFTSEYAGRKLAGKNIGIEEYMRGMDQVYGDKVNSAFKSVARNELKEANVKVIEEKTQAEVNNVDNNDQISLTKMNETIARTVANKNTVDEFTEQSYQIQMGLYKQNQDSWITRDNKGFTEMTDKSIEIMKNMSNSLGNDKTVDTLTKEGMNNNFSINERVNSKLNENASEIGEFSTDTINKKMEEMSKVHDFSSNKSSSLRDIKDFFGEASVIGAAGEMFKGVSSDKKAEDLTNSKMYKITASSMGSIQSSSAITDIYKNTDIFNELSNHTTGLEAITQGLNNKNISLNEINLIASVEKNNIKEFNIQKAIVAGSALSVLNDSVEAYKGLVNQGVLEFKRNNISIDQEISGRGFKDSVEIIKNDTLNSYAGVEVMAGVKIAQEVKGALGNVADLFSDIDDRDRDRKKTPQEQEEDNRKKRIQELEDKKNRGEKLTKNEKYELRRKIGEQNSLENIRKDSEKRQEKIKELIEKQKNNTISKTEKDELKRLNNIEKETGGFEKEKKVRLSKKLKNLLTVNGLSSAAINITKGGARIGGSLISEALGVGEAEMAFEAAKTLAKNPLAKAGGIGATAGLTIVAAVQDNISTTKDNLSSARDFIRMESKVLEAINENKIGSVYSFNVAPIKDFDKDQKNIIDLERSENGNYFFVIKGNRYSTDIKDNDFTDKEGRFYQFGKTNSTMNATYFIESLNEAFKPGLKPSDIAEEVNGALAVSRSMTNGFNSSFLANTNEWFHEKFTFSYDYEVKK